LPARSKVERVAWATFRAKKPRRGAEKLKDFKWALHISSIIFMTHIIMS